jgi:hypothetical protein
MTKNSKKRVVQNNSVLMFCWVSCRNQSYRCYLSRMRVKYFFKIGKSYWWAANLAQLIGPRDWRQKPRLLRIIDAQNLQRLTISPLMYNSELLEQDLNRNYLTYPFRQNKGDYFLKCENFSKKLKLPKLAFVPRVNILVMWWWVAGSIL